ncbi:MAG: CBS domain-containing protein [Sphingomonadales bacterium]|jgi:CBS domain-containing protein
MLIKTILSEKGGDIISVDGSTRIEKVTQVLKTHRIGAVLVLEGDGVIDGVLSERDIVRGLAEKGAGVLQLEAKALMTSDVITCTPDQDLRGAMEIMTTKRIRHLPIVENGRLIGLVSIGDLVKYRISEAEQEAEALRGYIATG